MRVIVNGVSFFTSKAAIKRGVGDNTNLNAALRICLDRMGKDLGLGTTIVVYDSKMNRFSYDVQLSK